MHSYTLLDEVHVLLTRQGESGQELVLVNTQTTLGTPFRGDDAPWSTYSSLSTRAGFLYFIGSYTDRSPTIEQLPLDGRPAETVRSCGGPQLDPADVSTGMHICFSTRDGREAHGFFYAPASHSHQGLAGTQPPLVVMSHGGPTSAASNSLSLRIQYYTTRGWAVLDVNYRGSTGFGREYRCALNGRWGELDVTDCEDGVRFLARTGRINPDQVAIRGGSAGGYTTLAALTTTDCFRVGASHYGIGDLSALAADTHKFESRYLDGLLGEHATLIERSPINHLDQFRCPVIFFQGSEDKVVPPNQSRAMAEALRSKGIPVAYLEFPGEGHGFRDAANIIRAVESEFGFFCRVFGIKAADDLPAIAIDNAENLLTSKEASKGTSRP
jgi:dipeptidyl aminopeptidase/acylaminoacyl peptidase